MRPSVLAVLIAALMLVPDASSTNGQQEAVADHSAATVEMEIVGQIGGAVRAVAGHASAVYIGLGPRLAVLDVSNAAAPQLRGMTHLLSDVVHDVVVSPTSPHAYVAAGLDGLHVVDVSNPDRPEVVSSYALPARAVAVLLQDARLYVGTEGAGLYILEASNPLFPTLLGQHRLPGSNTVRALDIVDGLAFLAAEGGGLQVADVSDPAAVQEVGRLSTDGFALDVAVVGQLAYVAAEPRWNPSVAAYVGGGLRVVDVSAPSEPHEVGFVSDMPGIPTRVLVRGRYAYVAAQQGGLRVLSVADPVEPEELGVLGLARGAVDLALLGDYMLLADADSGLRVVSMAQPATPTQIGGFSWIHDVQSLAVREGYAYVVDGTIGMHVLRVDDPTRLQLLSTIGLRGYASDITLHAGHAFVAAQADAEEGGGLFRLDVGMPSSPHVSGHYDALSFASAVDVQGTLAYVAADVEGLHIFDASGPATVEHVASLSTDGAAVDVAVSGPHAYVANGRLGLRVVGVDDPASPQDVATDSSLNDATGLVVSGTMAYIADARWGLAIVDVSDAEQPTEVGRYDTTGNARGVAISGQISYVADLNGVCAVFVGDAAGPLKAGYTGLPGQVTQVALSGNHVYVSAGEAGMFILHSFAVTPTPTPTTTREWGRIHLPIVHRSAVD